MSLIRFFQQSLAVALSLALFCTSSVSADMKGGPAERPLAARFAPPAKLGYLVDSFVSEYRSPLRLGEPAEASVAGSNGVSASQPLVILIQDLHAHYGVQKNIAGLLEFLDKKLNLTPQTQHVAPNKSDKSKVLDLRSEVVALPYALAVEGASGPVDTSVLAQFPDKKIKQRAADYLMKQGELSGAEYFAVMRGMPKALVGVEDETYYTVHRDLFRKTWSERERYVNLLRGMQSDLKELKRATYSKQLKIFERRLEQFEKGKKSLASTLSMLEKEAASVGMDMSGLRKSKSDDLYDNVSSASYLIKTQLAATKAEKELVQVEHDLSLLLKVADLRATENEVRTFGPRLNQFIALASALLGSEYRRDGVSASQQGVTPKRRNADTPLRSLISSSIDYYAMAMMRNQPMVDNTLALLSKDRPAAALVAGGFHTAPITKILRAKNISYIVLTPTVNRLTDADHKLYVKRLNGELLTVQDIVKDSSGSPRASYSLASLWPFARQKDVLAIGIVATGVIGAASLYHFSGLSWDQFLQGYSTWAGQHPTVVAQVQTALVGAGVVGVAAAIALKQKPSKADDANIRKALDFATRKAADELSGGLKSSEIISTIERDLKAKNVRVDRGSGRVATIGHSVVLETTENLNELYAEISDRYVGLTVHEWVHILQIEALRKAGLKASLVDDPDYRKEVEIPAYKLALKISWETGSWIDVVNQGLGLLTYYVGVGPAMTRFAVSAQMWARPRAALFDMAYKAFIPFAVIAAGVGIVQLGANPVAAITVAVLAIIAAMPFWIGLKYLAQPSRPPSSASLVDSVPPRLIQIFGEDTASTIYDETLKVVDRVMEGSSAVEIQARREKILQMYYSQHSWKLITKFSPHVVGHIITSAILLSIELGVALQGNPLSLIGGSIMTTLLAAYVIRTVKKDIRRILGLYYDDVIFIKPRMRQDKTRYTVAHEIGHEFFTVESHVQEALAVVRSYDEFPEMRQTAPIPELSARPLYEELENIERDLKAEAQKSTPSDLRKVEPEWSYVYGGNLGWILLYLTEGDLRLAYRMIGLMGKNKSLADAAREVGIVSTGKAGNATPQGAREVRRHHVQANPDSSVDPLNMGMPSARRYLKESPGGGRDVNAPTAANAKPVQRLRFPDGERLEVVVEGVKIYIHDRETNTLHNRSGKEGFGFKVGRDPASGGIKLRLGGRSSREQLEFFFQDGRWQIRDLSRNGTIREDTGEPLSKDWTPVYSVKENTTPAASDPLMVERDAMISEALQHNVELRFDRVLDRRTLDAARAMMETVREMSALLRKPRTRVVLVAATILGNKRLGNAHVSYSQGAAFVRPTQDFSKIGLALDAARIRRTTSHELLHKLSTMTDRTDNELVMPVRDWIELLKLHGMTRVYTGREGAEASYVPLDEYLNVEALGFDVVRALIRRLSGKQFPDLSSLDDLHRDPLEIVAYHGTGEPDGFGNPKQVRATLGVLQKNLLYAEGKVFTFDHRDARWKTTSAGQGKAGNAWPMGQREVRRSQPPRGNPILDNGMKNDSRGNRNGLGGADASPKAQAPDVVEQTIPRSMPEELAKTIQLLGTLPSRESLLALHADYIKVIRRNPITREALVTMLSRVDESRMKLPSLVREALDVPANEETTFEVKIQVIDDSVHQLIGVVKDYEKRMNDAILEYAERQRVVQKKHRDAARYAKALDKRQEYLNLLELSGEPAEPTAKQIKDQYKQYSGMVHPDKHENSPAAEAMFKQVKEAQDELLFMLEYKSQLQASASPTNEDFFDLGEKFTHPIVRRLGNWWADRQIAKASNGVRLDGRNLDRLERLEKRMGREGDPQRAKWIEQRFAPAVERNLFAVPVIGELYALSHFSGNPGRMIRGAQSMWLAMGRTTLREFQRNRNMGDALLRGLASSRTQHRRLNKGESVEPSPVVNSAYFLARMALGIPSIQNESLFRKQVEASALRMGSSKQETNTGMLERAPYLENIRLASPPDYEELYQTYRQNLELPTQFAQPPPIWRQIYNVGRIFIGSFVPKDPAAVPPTCTTCESFSDDFTFSFELEFQIKDQIGLPRDESLPAEQWDPQRRAVLDRVDEALESVGWSRDKNSPNLIEIRTGKLANTRENWDRLQTGLAALQVALPGGYYSVHMHVGKTSLTNANNPKKLNIDEGRLARVVKVFEAQWRALSGQGYSRSDKGKIRMLPDRAVAGNHATAHNEMINHSWKQPTLEFKGITGLLQDGHLDLSRLNRDVSWGFTLLEVVAEEGERLPLALLGIPAVAGDRPSPQQIEGFLNLVFLNDPMGRAAAAERFAALELEPVGLSSGEVKKRREQIREVFIGLGLNEVFMSHSFFGGFDADIVTHLLESATLDRLAIDLVKAGQSDAEARGFFPAEMHVPLLDALARARQKVKAEEIRKYIAPEWAKEFMLPANLRRLARQIDPAYLAQESSRREERLRDFARNYRRDFNLPNDYRSIANSWEGSLRQLREIYLRPMPLIIRDFSGLLKLYAFPKRTPYGAAGLVADIVGSMVAVGFHYFGVLSLNQMIDGIAMSLMLGATLGLAAHMYQGFLAQIRGEHREQPTMENVAREALEDRVMGLVRHLFGSGWTEGLNVKVVDDIIDIDQAAFNQLFPENAIQNAFGWGIYYDEKQNKLYVNNKGKPGQFVNNAAYSNLSQRLYVHQNAARATERQLSIVLAHEMGKRMYFSYVRSWTDLRAERWAAELTGNLIEFLAFLKIPLNKDRFFSELGGKNLLGRLGSGFISSIMFGILSLSMLASNLLPTISQPILNFSGFAQFLLTILGLGGLRSVVRVRGEMRQRREAEAAEAVTSQPVSRSRAETPAAKQVRTSAPEVIYPLIFGSFATGIALIFISVPIQSVLMLVAGGVVAGIGALAAIGHGLYGILFNDDRSGGAMKRMGLRVQEDEDALADLVWKHSDFEKQADAVAPHKAEWYTDEGDSMLVIEADLPPGMSAYHVTRAQGPPIIVVRPGLLAAVRTEALYHEAREIHWKKQINPKTGKRYTQPEAHILASAEQAKRFGSRTELTPYHASQIEGMLPDALEALIKEDAQKRETSHLELIAIAGLDYSFAVDYEEFIRAEASRRLLALAQSETTRRDALRHEWHVEVEKSVFRSRTDSGQWDILTLTLRAAQAFSNDFLNKRSKAEVADMLSRITGSAISSQDLSDNVSIEFHAQGTHKYVFKVVFTTSDGKKLDVLLALKREKGQDDISGVELHDTEALSGLTPYTPRFAGTFESKGRTFYLEEFVEGRTIRELHGHKGSLPQHIRALAVTSILGISNLLGAMPKDIHEKNFVVREMREPQVAVMVDLGERRTSVDVALLRLIAFYGYFSTHRTSGDNRFIFQSYLDTFGDEAGLELLKKNLAYIRQQVDWDLRRMKQPGETSPKKKDLREERREPALEFSEIQPILQELERFIKQAPGATPGRSDTNIAEENVDEIRESHPKIERAINAGEAIGIKHFRDADIDELFEGTDLQVAQNLIEGLEITNPIYAAANLQAHLANGPGREALKAALRNAQLAMRNSSDPSQFDSFRLVVILSDDPFFTRARLLAHTGAGMKSTMDNGFRLPPSIYLHVKTLRYGQRYQTRLRHLFEHEAGDFFNGTHDWRGPNPSVQRREVEALWFAVRVGVRLPVLDRVVTLERKTPSHIVQSSLSRLSMAAQLFPALVLALLTSGPSYQYKWAAFQWSYRPEHRVSRSAFRFGPQRLEPLAVAPELSFVQRLSLKFYNWHVYTLYFLELYRIPVWSIIAIPLLLLLLASPKEQSSSIPPASHVENVYQPSPSGSRPEKIQEVVEDYREMNPSSHQASSGQTGFMPDVQDGVIARLEGVQANEMFISGAYNMLDQGRFTREGSVRMVPQGKATADQIRVTVRLPALKAGRKSQMLTIFNGQVRSQIFTNGNVSIDSDGQMTIHEDIPQGTEITYTIVKQTANHRVEASMPMNASLQQEFAQIPAQIKTRLDAARNLSTEQRSAAVAEIMGRYFRYSQQQTVRLNTGTWGAFLDAKLESDGIFVSDCDVLSVYSYIFLKYLHIDAVFTLGYLNDDALITESDAHGTLFAYVGEAWRGFETTAMVGKSGSGTLSAGNEKTPEFNQIKQAELAVSEYRVEQFHPTVHQRPAANTASPVAALPTASMSDWYPIRTSPGKTLEEMIDAHINNHELFDGGYGGAGQIFKSQVLKDNGITDGSKLPAVVWMRPSLSDGHDRYHRADPGHFYLAEAAAQNLYRTYSLVDAATHEKLAAAWRLEQERLYRNLNDQKSRNPSPVEDDGIVFMNGGFSPHPAAAGGKGVLTLPGTLDAGYDHYAKNPTLLRQHLMKLRLLGEKDITVERAIEVFFAHSHEKEASLKDDNYLKAHSRPERPRNEFEQESRRRTIHAMRNAATMATHKAMRIVLDYTFTNDFPMHVVDELMLAVLGEDLMSLGDKPGVADQIIHILHNFFSKTAPLTVPAKPRVLLVDDDDAVRASNKDLLEFDGYEVTEAADGKLALELFKPGTFDIVLTDNNMTQMEGEVLARELQVREPGLPIVILTGAPLSLAEKDELSRSASPGVQRQWKPFNGKQLLETLKKGIQERQVETMDESEPIATLAKNGINEDQAFTRTYPGGIQAAAVMDGVGSKHESMLASRFVSQFLQHELDRFDWENREELMEKLWDLVANAQEAMNTHFAPGDNHDMGTTVMLLITLPESDSRKRVFVVGAGDSRAYAQLPDGSFKVLSIDNRIGGDVIHIDFTKEQGYSEMQAALNQTQQPFLSSVQSADELLGDSQRKAAFEHRHGVVNALKTEPGYAVDPSRTEVIAPEGTDFFVVTDGVSDNLTDLEMADHTSARALVEHARARSRVPSHIRGKVDDITAVKIESDMPALPGANNVADPDVVEDTETNPKIKKAILGGKAISVTDLHVSRIDDLFSDPESRDTWELSKRLTQDFVFSNESQRLRAARRLQAWLATPKNLLLLGNALRTARWAMNRDNKGSQFAGFRFVLILDEDSLFSEFRMRGHSGKGIKSKQKDIAPSIYIPIGAAVATFTGLTELLEHEAGDATRGYHAWQSPHEEAIVTAFSESLRAKLPASPVTPQVPESTERTMEENALWSLVIAHFDQIANLQRLPEGVFTTAYWKGVLSEMLGKETAQTAAWGSAVDNVSRGVVQIVDKVLPPMRRLGRDQVRPTEFASEAKERIEKRLVNPKMDLRWLVVHLKWWQGAWALVGSIITRLRYGALKTHLEQEKNQLNKITIDISEAEGLDRPITVQFTEDPFMVSLWKYGQAHDAGRVISISKWLPWRIKERAVIHEMLHLMHPKWSETDVIRATERYMKLREAQLAQLPQTVSDAIAKENSIKARTRLSDLASRLQAIIRDANVSSPKARIMAEAAKSHTEDILGKTAILTNA